MKVMILGATGLVGSHALQIALQDSRITEVIAPVRKELPPHPKLRSVIIDFENLPEHADWWKVDAVICALGTTIKSAKTKQAFLRVDHDYPLKFAKRTLSEGASAYVLNSAAGADEKSFFFYNQVKGKVEADISALNFSSCTIVRPGLIGGDRKESRFGEDIAKVILKSFGMLLPKSLKMNPAENIARRMVEEAILQKKGTQIILSSELC